MSEPKSVKETTNEDTDKTPNKQYEWLKDYQWKEGQSGNPKGRPKGKISIKDLVRKHLEKNPDDLVEFVKHFIETNRELAWQMIEGRPQESIDLEVSLPKPILDVQEDNSDKKDTSTNEED